MLDGVCTVLGFVECLVGARMQGRGVESGCTGFGWSVECCGLVDL